MIQVSRTQALKRWGVAPPSIREALFSDENAEALKSIVASEHIPKDKIPAVGKIAGLALLGFIHPDELVYELKDVLGVENPIAESIADALRRRVLAPVRDDIEKMYAPPTREEEGEKKAPPPAATPLTTPPLPTSTPTPKIVDIKPPKGEEVPPPAALPIVEEKKQEVVPKAPGRKHIAPPPAPAKPEGPALSDVEGPTILHKEQQAKPMVHPGFRLQFGKDLFKKPSTPEKQKETSPKLARLELGGEEKPTKGLEKSVTRTPEAPARVVHYTELRTPITPFSVQEKKSPPPPPAPSPMKPEGGREIPPPPPKEKDEKPKEEMIDLGSL